MRIPPNPPPNPLGSSGQPQTKQQMEDAIQKMLQKLFGDDATMQSPSGDGSTSYANDLKHLIDQFHKAKNWNQAEKAYQQIMLKLQEGDQSGSSPTSFSDFPPT